MFRSLHDGRFHGGIPGNFPHFPELADFNRAENSMITLIKILLKNVGNII